VNIRSYSGFFRPFAIERDSRGNFLIANFVTHPSVAVLSPNFATLGYLGKEGLDKEIPSIANSLFSGPHSFAIHPKGDIFITDYRLKRILRFSSAYEFLEVFLESKASWHLTGPASTRIDPDGNFIVSDYGSHSLQKFSLAKTFLGWLGNDTNQKIKDSWRCEGEPARSVALGGFDRVHDIAFDPEKNLIVIDTWNHRIQKFSSDGKFLGAIGMKESGTPTEGFSKEVKIVETRAPGGFSKPVSISMGSDFFVISEYGNSRIQKFSIHGEFLGWMGAGSGTQWTKRGESKIGDQSGEFHHPYGVSVTDGKILVADSDNHRIQVIEID
jgi:DNA-binding beta-propeller fold protein YncE